MNSRRSLLLRISQVLLIFTLFSFFCLLSARNVDAVICGNDDRKNARCYLNTGHVYDVSKAVVLLLNPDTEDGCTGFFVQEDIIMTNEHCINCQTDAESVNLYLGYERETCSGGDPSYEVIFKGDAQIDYLTSNAVLDYSLIRIPSGYAKKYTVLPLSSTYPADDDGIFVTQHSGGDPKSIDYTGKVKTSSSNNCGDCFEHDADIEGISSGSPIFLRSNYKLVGIQFAEPKYTGCTVNGNYAYNIADILSDLSTSGITQYLDDVYENNDSIASAQALKPGFYPTLSRYDSDYYKVSTTGQDIFVKLDFINARGDIDLALLDVNGTKVQESASSTDDVAQINYTVTSATKTDYYVHAYGGTNDNNIYNMYISIPPLGEALDDTSLTWTTGGDSRWFGQHDTYHSNDNAAESGSISHNEKTWLQTTMTGPADISFSWKVSSEVATDTLSFHIDGEQKSSISGEKDWQDESYSLPSGTYTLKWEYSKDVDWSSGSDCGWLDNIQVIYCHVPPQPSTIALSPDSSSQATISWADVKDATSYTLQQATDEAFSDATTVYEGPDTSYTVTGLTPGMYYFRVCAKNSCGSSDWMVGGIGIGLYIRYVKPDGVDPADCSNGGYSWDTAFKTIQMAIECASDKGEIWVQEGTYPLKSYLWVNKEVKIYGGFAGTEISRTDRKWWENDTIIDGGNSILCMDICASATVDGFILKNCANEYGGAMMIITPTVNPSDIVPRINNFVFDSNMAVQAGGAIYIEFAAPTITNCLFSGNTSGYYGGAVHSYFASPRIYNCTFSSNSAYSGGGLSNYYSSGIVKNSIIWGNTATSMPSVYDESSYTGITYSLVEDGYNGAGNKDADPLFEDAVSGDYSLASLSPCVDAGTLIAGLPATDLLGQTRVLDGDGDGISTIDMGACERVRPPKANIQANASNGPIYVSKGTPVSVTISLDPGSQPSSADWWLIKSGPDGWCYYDVMGGSWSFSPGLSATYQGSLFDLASLEILKTTALTLGTHVFYFGVDSTMNGMLDMDSIFYDSVSVNIYEP